MPPYQGLAAMLANREAPAPEPEPSGMTPIPEDQQQAATIAQFQQNQAQQPNPVAANAPAYAPGSNVSSSFLNASSMPPINTPVKSVVSSKVLGLLSNFGSGFGEALMHFAGVQTPLQRQKTINDINESQIQQQSGQIDNALKMRRLQMMGHTEGIQSAVDQLGKLSPDEQAIISGAKEEANMKGDFAPITSAIQHIASTRATQSRQFKSVPGLGLWDFRDPNNPQPINGTAPPQITVTGDMASKLGIPGDLIGKTIPLAQLSPFVRATTFGSVPVMGTEGPALVNRNPLSGEFGKVTKLGLGSPAQAGAYWQAKYGLVKSVDENGAPTYIPRIDAAGAPVSDNAFNIMKGKAGLDNFKDALGRIDKNLDVMDDPSQRALVARTLRNIGTNADPGVIWSAIGTATSEGLTPQGADLVAATLNAREWIGANRSFAGNFRGSEALYQRMVSNVPGAANSNTLNRALIKQDMNNTTKVEGMLRVFQKTPQANNAPPPGAKVRDYTQLGR